MNKVFYQCATGPNNGFIQDIREQAISTFRYVYVHDEYTTPVPDRGWEYLNINDFVPDAKTYGHKQRFAKARPDVLFPDAKHTVWLDPKWYISREFFELCNSVDSEWMLLPHPDPNRTTLSDELTFAFNNGTLTFEECKRVVDVIKTREYHPSQFYSSLATWMIRINSKKNVEIGRLWYELIDEAYDNFVRDQVFLPFCIPRDHFDMTHDVSEIEESGCLFYYPPSERIRPKTSDHTEEDVSSLISVTFPSISSRYSTI